MADKKRVLLVDDDRATVGLYEEVLGGVGYEVVAAYDGKIGLKLALEGGFDVILLDIVMPGLDGIGFLTELTRGQPQKANGPVIVMTNLSGDPVVKQAMDLGAKACFIKTEATPDDVIAKISALTG